MAKDDAKNVQGLDAAGMAQQLKEGAEQMFRLRFQMSMGQMEGVKKYRSLRKERARIKTEQRKRALDGAASAAGKVVKVTASAPKAAAPKAGAKPAVKKAAVKKAAVKKTATTKVTK